MVVLAARTRVNPCVTSGVRDGYLPEPEMRGALEAVARSHNRSHASLNDPRRDLSNVLKEFRRFTDKLPLRQSAAESRCKEIFRRLI